MGIRADVKRLHLVKPEEQVFFLDEGRGQKGRILKIPKNSEVNLTELQLMMELIHFQVQQLHLQQLLKV